MKWRAYDAMGLGHLGRNLAIAESPLRASVLILSGVREAGALRLPARAGHEHVVCRAELFIGSP